MTISELKLELIAKIIATNDIAMLEEISAILNFSKTSEENSMYVNEPTEAYSENKQKVYVFNEEQEQRINKALDQYKNGECISDEEAQKEIQAWLED